MTETYLVENSHDAADCDAAFDSLESAVVASDANVRDDTLLCTCPDGAHGGSVIIEAKAESDAESFADHWDVGDTTVNQLTEMEVG